MDETSSPAGTDRVETDLGVLAGVSDRGLVHATNEDAMALGRRGDTIALVVCDGVSTVRTPELASRLAVDTALAALLDDPEPDPGPGVERADEQDPDEQDPDGMFARGQRRARAAVAAAAAAVAGLGDPDQRDAPSCTLVCALVEPDPAGTAVTVAWVGDSRAYWLAERPDVEPSVRLTTDHSWAYALVEAGALDESAAMAHPQAHAITRWLGAGGDAEPDVVSRRPAGAGVLLVCTDGLWNYLPDAGELTAAAAIGDPSRDLGGPLGVVRRLTELALKAGGRDNITAVMVPVAGPEPAAGPGGP